MPTLCESVGALEILYLSEAWCSCPENREGVVPRLEFFPCPCAALMRAYAHTLVHQLTLL